jgi:uncharacterized protein YaiL (DUF2058 family)
MAGSLQEQLLKAGLVDAERLKAAKKSRHHEKKSADKSAKKGGSPAKNDTDTAVEQARREKTDRDRRINSERQRQAELRALRSQIGEIVVRHRLDREGGETPYQFADRGKIKKIYVLEDMPQGLAEGRLAVVRLEGRYDIVPASIASRIVERDPRCVIVFNIGQKDAEPVDDTYADYPVPDDLTW